MTKHMQHRYAFYKKLMVLIHVKTEVKSECSLELALEMKKDTRMRFTWLAEVYHRIFMDVISLDSSRL